MNELGGQTEPALAPLRSDSGEPEQGHRVTPELRVKIAKGIIDQQTRLLRSTLAFIAFCVLACYWPAAGWRLGLTAITIFLIFGLHYAAAGFSTGRLLRRSDEFFGDDLFTDLNRVWPVYYRSADGRRRLRLHEASRILPPASTGCAFYERLDAAGRTIESSFVRVLNAAAQQMPTDLQVCRVRSPEPPRTRFYRGRPPAPGKPDRRRLYAPAATVIRQTDGTGVYLSRLDAHWRFAGQTWHPDQADAQAQMLFEFNWVETAWLDLTPGADLVRRAKQRVAREAGEW